MSRRTFAAARVGVMSTEEGRLRAKLRAAQRRYNDRPWCHGAETDVALAELALERFLEANETTPAARGESGCGG